MTDINVYPYHILWQITRACNFRCLHCSADGGKPAEEELSLEEILDIMDQLKSIGVVDLAFSGGEPLLRADIFDIITAAVKKNFCVGIGTNGWNVSREVLEELKSCGINRLQVSIDGLEESHDSIRRPGSFVRALETVHSAVSIGLKVHLCYTPQRSNLHHFEPLVKLASDMGIALFNVSQFVPVGRGTEDQDLSPQEWKWVMSKWKEMRDNYKGKMEFRTHLSQLALIDPLHASRQGFRGCAAGRGQACITPEGYVTPCVLIPAPIGDLRIQSFGEIWRGSPCVRKLQVGRNLKGKCSVCIFMERCGGCRATALAYHGDLFGEDPHCWL